MFVLFVVCPTARPPHWNAQPHPGPALFFPLKTFFFPWHLLVVFTFWLGDDGIYPLYILSGSHFFFPEGLPVSSSSPWREGSWVCWVFVFPTPRQGRNETTFVSGGLVDFPPSCCLRVCFAPHRGELVAQSNTFCTRPHPPPLQRVLVTFRHSCQTLSQFS